MTRHPPAQLTFSQAALLACCTGIWVGLARVAGLAASVVFLRRLVEHGVHLTWMAPLASVLECLGLGIVLWSIGSVVSWFRTPFGYGLLLLAVQGTALILNVQGLHPLSAFVLGAGAALSAGRWMARSITGLLTAARWSSVVGAVLVLFAGAATAFFQTSGAFAAQSRNQAQTDRPNILLIVLDTVRARSLGLYGGSRTSPNLDLFASRGVRFDQAYAPAPWTTPSHASMLTGEWPTDLDVSWHEGLSGRYETVAEALRDAGYVTAGFSANLRNAGLSSGLARGFSRFEDYPPTRWNFLRSSSIGERVVDSVTLSDVFGWRSAPERRRSPDITSAFLRWLPASPDRPFFAFLNYFDAHDPYEAPLDIERQFDVPQGDERPSGEQLERRNWNPGQAEALLRAYHAAIASQDKSIGELIRSLDERGVLQKTLVIVTSDHGEEFLEHGLMWHGHSLHHQAVHVPLVMVMPGQLQAAASVETPVTLRSIATTIARAGGASHRFPGIDLIDVARGAPGEPVLMFVDGIPQKSDAFPVHFGSLRAVVDSGYRYVVDGRRQEFLFRLTDEAEVENLAGKPELNDLLAKMRAHVERLAKPKGGS